MDIDASADSPWTFAGESSPVGDSSITLVDGTTFLVCSRGGDITAVGPQGLFMVDTRVISAWRMGVNGREVEPLSVSPNGPFSATFVGRVHDPSTVDAPLTVVQRRHVGNGMREDIEIRNHTPEPIRLQITLALQADFGNLFDVKAGRTSPAHSSLVRVSDSVVHIVQDTLDGKSLVDAVVVASTTAPTAVDEGSLRWTVDLGGGDQWNNCLLVGVTIGGTHLEPSYGCGEPIDQAIPVSRLQQWREAVTSVTTDSPALASAVERAAEDLGALRIFDTDHPERVVVAAGAPWFMTLFGRDSLLASWMALPLDQDLSIGVLRELADAQGRDVNPTTEEQPGRILHEVRFDTARARLLGGSNIYYGTVDATPLFVMLVAELARWTGLTPAVVDLMPAVDRALDWIEDYGDRDGDGFVEYLRSDPDGLENQGWKDSWDGIRHRDGSVARGPIALCEVQGYVHAAFRGRAELGRALGEPRAVTQRFDERAEELRVRFDDAFWIDEAGWYAVALDGDKRTVASRTSNLGHLLWTGIIPQERAERLAGHLVDPAMFTGWGIRTLASDNAGYNPLSYHCGSVWPHDTAIAVAGLARYGCDEQAQTIACGLLDASTHSGGRLPELFGGFGRDDLHTPVPYPASCSPQAWSAAAPLLLVRSMLGLQPNLLTGRVDLRPRLAPGLNHLELSGVPIGSSRVDITVGPQGVDVRGLDDDLMLQIDWE